MSVKIIIYNLVSGFNFGEETEFVTNIKCNQEYCSDDSFYGFIIDVILTNNKYENRYLWLCERHGKTIKNYIEKGYWK